ncbi:PAS domain S-box protein [uncultured Desulfobacter sp.]|uniref:PAS domain S-box protein n=1 Tax=uncultured Desulfobacter sp. TaxID=240139 RepID=UPI0029C70A64|nr:PAS domain S-box protein [uncultured Desulfobacter sp.]
MSSENAYKSLGKDDLLAILLETEKLANIGGWEWDIVNDIWTFSDNWLRIHGCTKRHLGTEDLIAIAHPEDRDAIRFSFNEAAERAAKYEIQHRIIRQDTGEKRYVHACGVAKLNKRGEVVKLYGSAQDITERKQLEEATHKREGRYKAILQTAIDGFWITDINGHFLEVNSAYSKMSGYSQNELLTMQIADVETGEDFKEIEKHLKKGITIGYDCFESFHRRKDNSTYPVEINFTYSDKEGGRFVVFIKDISERKEAEDNLLKNRYYLAKAQEIGKIGTWELDIQKNSLIWTDENYKIFGVPLGTKLNYEIFLSCIHPEDREYVDKKWNDALKSKSYDIIHRVIADNKTKWVREKADIKFDSEGNPTIAVGFTQDLTGLKEIENALQESEEKFKTMFEKAPLSYQSLDENGCFKEVNQTWLKTMGYTREEVLGKNFNEFLVPEWKNHFKENFPRFKAVGEILGVEFEMVKKNGDAILVSFHGKIAKNETGGFKQTHCIFQDITSIRQAEASSNRLKERLESLWNITKIADSDIQTISDHVLEEVQKITQSKYAFYGFIDQDQKFLKLHAWSTDTMASCKVTDQPLHFDIETAGIWANAVRNNEIVTLNDFSLDLPGKKGLPDGHVPLNRIMAVPLIRNDRVISIAVVANKKEKYTGEDEDQVKAFLKNVQILIDRKAVTQELQRSEQKFAKVFHNAPLMIAISDYSTGEILDANQEHLKLSGYTRDELIGRRSEEIDWIRPEDRRRLVEMIKSQGYVRGQKLTVYSKTRDPIPCIYNGVLVDVDGESRIVSIAHDISEQMKAEGDLRKQKNLFETMFNTIPDGVVITNTEREIILANRGMKNTFGYTPEELIGKKTKCLYAGQKEFQATGSEIFNKDTQNPHGLYISRYRKKDGKLFTGETFGAKLYDGKNQWIGNLGIMRDITDREQTEKRLQQAQKMESIGSLAGGIAHDFNNILFPIVGMSELLLEDLLPGSVERENAEEILKAGKRGSDLVKQILAFSRQSEHTMMPTRIQNILNEVIKLSRSTIPTYIEIKQDIQKDCGMVLADPSQIHQIGMNLITNAYHAVEDTGGTISVKLRQADLKVPDRPDMNLTPGNYAVISISDSGHGMPTRLLEKIFDPYFTTKQQGKGTGLGLAVVYGIVKEHGGEIKVYSEIGNGSKFEIYLPLMKKTIGPESLAEVEENPGGNERILLVDDEGSIAKLEKQMLERMGYMVTSRLHSVEALEAFRASPSSYDLVITDMSMPNIPGDELARKIKSIKSDVPIIICTGFSERIHEGNIKQMDIDGLLMKPVVKSDLAKLVRNVLDDAQGKI